MATKRFRAADGSHMCALFFATERENVIAVHTVKIGISAEISA